MMCQSVNQSTGERLPVCSVHTYYINVAQLKRLRLAYFAARKVRHCKGLYSPLVTYGTRYLRKLCFIDTEYCIFMYSILHFCCIDNHIAQSLHLQRLELGADQLCLQLRKRNVPSKGFEPGTFRL